MHTAKNSDRASLKEKEMNILKTAHKNGSKLSMIALSFAMMLFTTMPAMAQDVDLNSYLRDMGHTLQHGWLGGAPDVNRSAIVEFTLHSNGAVSEVKISKTSGSKAVDDAAVKTVEKTTLPALPAGAPPEVDVNFTFHLNLYS
jgi:TonB family protein